MESETKSEQKADVSGPGGDWTDWTGTALGLGAVAIATGLLLLLSSLPSKGTLFLSLLAGCVGGWLAGIIITPYDDAEQRRIGDVAKVLSGLFTGYVAGKADTLFTIITPKDAKNPPILFLQHLAFFMIGLITVAIVVYVSRSYGLRLPGRDKP